MTMQTLTPWSDELNQIQARVLADSISPEGKRLTTLIVTFHRFVLAEFNTHRVFSRNSASSRAIPVAKQLEKIRNHPAFPVSFPAEQKGMQGDELTDLREVAFRDPADARLTSPEGRWGQAAHEAVRSARSLAAAGVHKSVTNRLLEPFMWHTVIVTATEWEGFWAQRCSPLAQPEIRVAAEQMKLAYDASTPTPLDYGEWHTPMIQPDEDDAFWHNVMTEEWKRCPERDIDDCRDPKHIKSPDDARKRVSSARIARVSYETHDGIRDIEADLGLFDDLTVRDGSTPRRGKGDPVHWSPLEHVATPCMHPRAVEGGLPTFTSVNHRGNFDGFDQFRHEVETA